MGRRNRSPILAAHPRDIAELIRKLRGGLTRRQILVQLGCDPDSRADYNHICRIIRDFEIAVKHQSPVPRRRKPDPEQLGLTKAQLNREIEAYRRGLRAAGKDPATLAQQERKLAIAEARDQMQYRPAPPYKPRIAL